MYHLFIATPEKIAYDSAAQSLLAPGTLGYLEILTDHAPLITTLKPGKLEITNKEGKKELFAVAKGYLDVQNNHVTLLADAIEPAEEINLELAQTALKKAQQRLETANEETDRIRAKKALARAENRIAVYELKKSQKHFI